MTAVFFRRRRMGGLLGRPVHRRTVGDALAQRADRIIAEETHQRLRRRIVVGDAHAGGEADRPPYRIEQSRAVALEPGKIETVENPQREEELKAFRGRRHGMDEDIAIGGRHGRQPFRPHGTQILLVEGAAARTRSMMARPSAPP